MPFKKKKSIITFKEKLYTNRVGLLVYDKVNNKMLKSLVYEIKHKLGKYYNSWWIATDFVLN